MENKNGFIYYQRVQNDAVPYHINEIQLSDIDLSRPTIIEFTGSGALETRAVNGYLKITESQLGSLSKAVNIIGIDYNAIAGYPEQNVQVAAEHSKAFVDEFLVPLALDENGKTNVLKACKNYRNIIFKTHCMGHEVVYYIHKNLKNKLLELGYTSEEVDFIMSQILEISFGAEYVELKFKQAIAVSYNDREVYDRYYSFDALRHNFDNVEMSKEDRAELSKIYAKKDGNISKFFDENERVYIINNDGKEIVFCFSSPIDTYGDDHSVHFGKLGKNLEKAERATNVGHYLAQAMSSVLCNAVEKSLFNKQSENLIQLDLEELRLKANEVVRPLNSDSPASHSQKGE